MGKVDLVKRLKKKEKKPDLSELEELFLKALQRKSEKDLEERAKIKKKKDAFSAIDDDKEIQGKKNDKFLDGVLGITVKMDGFERFHIEQYAKQLQAYQRFLSEYLRENVYGSVDYDYSSLSWGEEDRGPVEARENQQTATFKEVTEIIRATKMNQTMHCEANYIDPDMMERYKMWALFQHNFIMSHLYYSSLSL